MPLIDRAKKLSEDNREKAENKIMDLIEYGWEKLGERVCDTARAGARMTAISYDEIIVEDRLHPSLKKALIKGFIARLEAEGFRVKYVKSRDLYSLEAFKVSW